jgi:hypothetical protein
LLIRLELFDGRRHRADPDGDGKLPDPPEHVIAGIR